MNELATFVQRRPLLILWTSLMLSLVGGFFAIKLYQNLRTDLEELLPESSRSVRDLNEVTRRLKSIDKLAILVFSRDTKASKRFVTDLAKELETFPKDEAALVEYRIDRELEFFRKRQALFMDRTDLMKIQDYVRERIAHEKSTHSPFSLHLDDEEKSEPKLDVNELRKKYEGQTRDFSSFPDGFFATPNETKRAILIDTPGKTLGINGVKRLKARVDESIEKLNPHSYAQDLEIRYTGSVEEMLEEQAALVEDLTISTIVVVLLVTITMLVFYRSLWATAALVISVLASTIWTFGVSYFVVGYLNANSAFLGSIVLGNGINFGIILLARYMEERRIGRTHLWAAQAAMTTTSKATLTAALAAGLSYGSLMLTSFRGFAQFGVIGLMGMALCWLSAYTLLPALLAAADKLRLLRRKTLCSDRGAFLSNIIARVISRIPRPIALIASTLTLLSVFLLTHAGTNLIEVNLEKIRSQRSTQSGAGYYTRDLNEIFQRFLTPIVILPSSHRKALEIGDRLRQLKHEQGTESPIVSVQTIDDFVPNRQHAKIMELQRIRDLLKPEIVAKLNPKDRKNMDELLTPEAFEGFGMNDLPSLVKDKFSETDGSIGRLVLVEPPLTRDIWEAGKLTGFIESLRTVTDSIDAGAPVAGGMAVSADLMASISRDGPRATLLAFLAAVCLVIILFREPRTFVPALFALLVGVSWFGGIVVILAQRGFKINFLNFVALPITFGIGVDYGVNIFQRYRQRRRGGIIRVIRETGGAVGLCSLTTIIGYCSLLMASNQGLISFGVLAVLGEITCVTAAIVALPAVLASFSKEQVKSASVEASP